jgi:undecaprenyl-diphosphatase
LDYGQKKFRADSLSSRSCLSYIYRAFLVLSIGLLITVGFIWLINGESLIELEERLLIFFRHSSDLANPLGSTVIEEAIRDLTSLGSTLVTTLVTIFVVILLYLYHKPRSAIFLASAVLLGLAYAFLIKLGFDRPRPDVVPHFMHSLSPSFPSAHSSMSAIVYLLIAEVLAREFPNKSLRIFIFIVAILITVSVGISRVYLGVHWPTDVLGGWIIGVTWVLTCWMVEKALVTKKILD